jgi:hypothetical protein
MTTRVIIGIGAALGWFFLSCTYNTPFAAMPASAAAQSPESRWSNVSEKTSCEAMNPQQCVGNHGFTVQPDGTYTVGPDEFGTSESGRISSEELDKLNTDADGLLGTYSGAAPNCFLQPGVPGISDQVDLAAGISFSVQAYKKTANRLCVEGDSNSALALHDDLHALLLEYYPRPFP